MRKWASEIPAIGELRTDSNDCPGWFILGWRRAGLQVALGKAAARDGTIAQLEVGNY